MSRDVVTTVISRLLLVGLGLAMTIVTSRHLGPAARGDFAVIISLASLVVQLGHLGLGSTGTYQLAGDRSRFARLVSNSLWISVVWGGFVAISLTGTIYWLDVWRRLPASYLLLGGILGLPLMFQMLGSNLLVGLERISLYNALQVLQGVTLAAALSLCWFCGGSVTSFLAASASASMLSAILMGIVLWRSGGKFSSFDWSLFGAGISYSAKTYIICLLGFLIMRMNLFAVERWSAPEDTGYLSLAIQGAEVLLIVPVSLGTVLFPRLVRNETSRWSLAYRNALVVGALMAVVCVMMAVLSRPLIQFIFGSAFLPTARVLVWMLPGVFAASLLSVVSQFLSAMGVPRSQVGMWFVGLAVSALTLWIEVPVHGAVGGAMAYSLSMGTVCVLACVAAYALSKRQAPIIRPMAMRRAA